MARTDRSRAVLLGLLAQGPRSGYDIKQTIDEMLSHFWSESFGQIYPKLRALESEGLIRRRSGGAGPRARVEYAITAAGRRALRSWLMRPAEPPRPRLDILLKVTFGGELPAAERRRHIEAYRAARVAQRAEYAGYDRELAPLARTDRDAALARLTLRYGQLVTEAVVQWCDEALAELDRIARLETPTTM
jgi:DNA-binding PadR family transcriptional regulator